jgi:homoserine dehydrogenase
MARAAFGEGRRLRFVATGAGPLADLLVRLEAVGQDDPLHRLPGSEKAVVYDCGPAGSIVVSGGRSDPRGAALALLKDVVNLATGDASPGID